MGTLVPLLALSWPLGSKPRDRQPCKVGFLVTASKTKASLSKEQTGGEGDVRNLRKSRGHDTVSSQTTGSWEQASETNVWTLGSQWPQGENPH